MMRIHAKVIYRGNVNIEGLVPHIIQTFVHMGERLFYLSESISLLHRRHNDLVHEANRAQHRLQQSWNTLSDAYAAFFADVEALS